MQDAVDLKKVQAEYAFVVQGLQSSNAETQALHAKGQLRLEKAEQERDEALKTVATLVSEKEGQLDSHRRLLKGAQDRELALVEKLKLAERSRDEAVESKLAAVKRGE
eukprot:jgi/Undpi1/2041/HiC_scaffold_12.g05427.m1